MKLYLKTDEYGEESSWDITDVSTGKEEIAGIELASSLTLYIHHYCFPSATCMKFEIRDYYSNGIFEPYGRYDLSVDGIIVTGYAPPADLKKLFKNLPAVYAYNILSDPNDTLKVDRVVPDNKAIGKIAADYLSEEKCKKAVYLDPSPAHPEFKVRGEAFKKAFKANSGEAVLIVHGKGKSQDRITDPDMKEGVLEQQIDELLEMKGVDSLFIPSDRLTARVYACLREKGVSPSDYKIISCNNEEPYLEGLYPHPATIEIGAEKIGEAAVQQLIRRLATKDGASEILRIQPELIRNTGKI